MGIEDRFKCYTMLALIEVRSGGVTKFPPILPIAIEGEGLPGQSVIGVGSLKILSGKNSQIFALSNRITRNVETNSTGSTISLLSSIDGLAWQVVIGDLIGPETEVENSWKRAYVYGFDKIQDPTSDQHWLVFYNGRDGWLVGREAIGVSRLDMAVIDLLLHLT